MMNRWNQKKLQKLNKKIKGNWKKLTDEEIASYQESPDVFFDIVKKKYGIFREDAERRVMQLKRRPYFFSWYHRNLMSG